MSKPDGITVDVWVSAMDALGVDSMVDNHERIVAVAETIVAAKAQEREACAQLVEDYEPDLKSWDGPTERSNARSATDYACIDIAASIRKRTEAIRG